MSVEYRSQRADYKKLPVWFTDSIQVLDSLEKFLPAEFGLPAFDWAAICLKIPHSWWYLISFSWECSFEYLFNILVNAISKQKALFFSRKNKFLIKLREAVLLFFLPFFPGNCHGNISLGYYHCFPSQLSTQVSLFFAQVLLIYFLCEYYAMHGNQICFFCFRIFRFFYIFRKKFCDNSKNNCQ